MEKYEGAEECKWEVKLESLPAPKYLPKEEEIIDIKHSLPAQTPCIHTTYIPCAKRLMISRCQKCRHVQSHYEDKVGYNRLRRQVYWDEKLVRVVVQLSVRGKRVVDYALKSSMRPGDYQSRSVREVVLLEGINKTTTNGAELKQTFASAPAVVVVDVEAAPKRNPNYRLLLITVVPLADAVEAAVTRLAASEHCRLPQYAPHAPLQDISTEWDYDVEARVSERTSHLLKRKLVNHVLECEPRLLVQDAIQPDIPFYGENTPQPW